MGQGLQVSPSATIILYGGFYNLKPPSSESLPLKEGDTKRRKIGWLAEPQLQQLRRERA